MAEQASIKVGDHGTRKVLTMLSASSHGAGSAQLTCRNAAGKIVEIHIPKRALDALLKAHATVHDSGNGPPYWSCLSLGEGRTEGVVSNKRD